MNQQSTLGTFVGMLFGLLLGFVLGGLIGSYEAHTNDVVNAAKARIAEIELQPPQLNVKLSADELMAIYKNTETDGIQEAIDSCAALLGPREYRPRKTIELGAQNGTARILMSNLHFDGSGAPDGSVAVWIGDESFSAPPR